MSIEHDVTIEALEQLGKNRPGRTWLRDNVKIWDEEATMLKDRAEKLSEMAQTAERIIEANKKEAKEEEAPNGSEQGDA